ncbi:pentatricopeptide repeat-containing protein At2g20710, mitochondrial-like [Cornus florida]|uniref:pentatricopeptide repeat-containing protein At2g20710, mitochondrial-like n=1 Tax=Cornus florida TaxID=4283 RepID=UPI0028963C0B|nr:pentatricopeptide repeat-containing protein At2g20710, mitochondrial-like [Cornus florida]
MKLSLSSLLNSRPKFAYYQKGLRHFFSSSPTPISSSSFTGSGSLYRRISPIGNPNLSVVPVLDQWVREGKNVTKEELRHIIKELKTYKRFKHALEVSEWMTEKRYICLSASDTAARLNLISRVHGLEQAENYFNTISQQLIGFEIYTALLNCYAQDKSVEKAEAVMQKLRDMGFARTPLSYNILMNLYCCMRSWEKIDALIHEMEEKGIFWDNYTFTIRLTAYAAASDSEGIDMTVARMESDPRVVLNTHTYSVAANGYLKVGLVDKALAMMNKLEGLIANMKTKNVAFDILLRLHAKTGTKDELYRIWSRYKKEKVYNKGYISMMHALLNFNDIEGAEKIFKEWESMGLSYDFRIPNFLIDAYCKNGLLGKAESLVNRGIEKRGNPTVDTWYYLAGRYIEDNQVSKAVETLKKAILVCPPNWKPDKDILATCLKHLESQGDVEEAKEFIGLLKVKGIFSAGVHERLLSLVKGWKSQSQAQ